MESALLIFAQLAGYVMSVLLQYLGTLHGVLGTCLQHESMDVRVAALRAACAFINVRGGRRRGEPPERCRRRCCCCWEWEWDAAGVCLARVGSDGRARPACCARCRRRSWTAPLTVTSSSP